MGIATLLSFGAGLALLEPAGTNSTIRRAPPGQGFELPIWDTPSGCTETHCKLFSKGEAILLQTHVQPEKAIQRLGTETEQRIEQRL